MGDNVNKAQKNMQALRAASNAAAGGKASPEQQQVLARYAAWSEKHIRGLQNHVRGLQSKLNEKAARSGDRGGVVSWLQRACVVTDRPVTSEGEAYRQYSGWRMAHRQQALNREGFASVLKALKVPSASHRGWEEGTAGTAYAFKVKPQYAHTGIVARAGDDGVQSGSF